MFRKLLSVLMAILTVGLMAVNVSADNIPISIYVNEKEISTDNRAYIEKGTTFVPLRAICNGMGIEDVQWDGVQQKATVNGFNKIEFYAGKKYAYVDGVKKTMPYAAELKNGRTMIPLRFFAEISEADVEWDNILHSVKITKDGIKVPEVHMANSYSSEEILWLSRIVEAESAGEPVKGQIAVANVVLNRVKDSNYPDTIRGVIFDRNYGVQFQPVANGTIYNTPSRKCVSAAKRAVNGENYVGRCLYFLNERIATNMWIVKNRDYYTTIHNHSFYL